MELGIVLALNDGASELYKRIDCHLESTRDRADKMLKMHLTTRIRSAIVNAHPPFLRLVHQDGYRARAEHVEDMPMDSSLPSQETQRLLARTPIIQSACDLDLLTFLHRHPRTLLTSEQLAGFVGYALKDIARALEAFIDAGLLGRTAQQSGHAARMYLLLLDGPQGGGVRALLTLATTRSGRQGILDILNEPRSSPEQLAATPSLTLVKWGG